jgi:hypothetical protein
MKLISHVQKSKYIIILFFQRPKRPRFTSIGRLSYASKSINNQARKGRNTSRINRYNIKKLGINDYKKSSPKMYFGPSGLDETRV